MEPSRRRARTLAAVSAVVVALAVPGAILWSSITWTDRAEDSHDAAGAITLSVLGDYADRVLDGEPKHAAIDAARQRALTSSVDGVTVEDIRIEDLAGTGITVEVEVSRSGPGAWLAERITGADVTHGRATGTLASCTEAPTIVGPDSPSSG